MSSQNFDMNRFLTSIPIITKILLAINIGIHAIIFLLSTNIGEFAISANLVIYRQEYYRLISSAFVHGGIMHIFFNMSTLLQLGMDLETQFGSLSFLFLSLWSIIIVGLLYISFAWILTYLTGNPSFLFSSAVGYSGILFTYAVIEAFHAREPTRSVFGLFSVPSKIYPFILLIILQVIIPNISFFGHFSGVVFGLAVVAGLTGFILPSSDALTVIESYSYCSILTRNGSFIRDTGKSYAIAGSSGAVIGGTIWAGVSYIFSCIINIIYTFFHMIGCPISSCTERISSYYQGLITCLAAPFHRPAATPDDSQHPPSAYTGTSHRLVDSIAVVTNNMHAHAQGHGDYRSLPTDEEAGVEINKIASPTTAFTAVRPGSHQHPIRPSKEPVLL